MQLLDILPDWHMLARHDSTAKLLIFLENLKKSGEVFWAHVLQAIKTIFIIRISDNKAPTTKESRLLTSSHISGLRVLGSKFHSLPLVQLQLQQQILLLLLFFRETELKKPNCFQVLRRSRPRTFLESLHFLTFPKFSL